MERKTLRRILVDLQAAGLRLEEESDPPNVFWSVPKTWFPGAVAFRGDDLADLARSLQLAPQSAKRDRLLGIIATTATGIRGTSTASAILTRALSPTEESALVTLQEAVQSSQPLGVKYYTLSRGDLAWRVLSIHRLLVDVGRFIATCHRDGSLKWFRLDGVQAVRPEPHEAFRAAPDAAVADLIDQSVDGYHSGQAPTVCSFRVDAANARWVKGQFQMPLDVEEGPLETRFTVTTSGLLPLARFVVGLGRAARVETPELLALVRQLAKGALGED